MDFRTLTYFVTVADELNITRAAEKLNISQPPLSAQIKQLEEDLGTELFIRGKRHLKLTESGLLFYRRASQILSLAADTRDELAALENELSGKIRIGVVAGRAPYLTARCIAGFREEYPLVTYSLWTGSSDDVLERLNKNLADLAVIAAPFDEEHYEGIEIGSEPWVALIPAEHPLAKLPGDTLPVRKLKDVPLILPERHSRLEAIGRWFSSCGITPNIICTLSDYMDAIAMVEQGIGVSIFPQTTYTPNPYVVTRLLTRPSKVARYDLVWPKRSRPPGAPGAFIDFTRDFVEADRIDRDNASRPAGKAALFQEIRNAELL